MKLINFLKKNWIYITFGILFFVFILFGCINKCSINHTDNLIDKIEKVQRDKFVVDSVSRIYEKKITNSIDSTNKKRNIEISILKQKVNNIHKIINDKQYQVDTLLSKFENSDSINHTLPVCKKIVDGQKQIIKQQDLNLKDKSSIIIKQDSTIKDDSVKYLIKINEVIRVRNMYDICDQNSKQLIKELNGKQTWFKRNEKWLYFIGGIVSIGGMHYLLK